MKHIKLYESFLQTPLSPGVEEITYDDYHAKNGMLRSIQNVAFTKEEKQILEMLREEGNLQKNTNVKKEFETARSIPRTNGHWAPPGVTFGKKVNGKYYLSTYLTDFSHKFYISQSLEDLLRIAIDVIKPEFLDLIDWIKIK